MSGPLQSLPASARHLSSTEIFQKAVREEVKMFAETKGKSVPNITMDSFKIINDQKGDGKYRLVYENPELDLFVEGKVLANAHRMHLFSGTLKGGEALHNMGVLEMTDACTLSKAVGAEQDLRNPNKCQDGVIDPDLVAARNKYQSITRYEEFCQKAFKKYSTEKWGGEAPGKPFTLERSFVVNFSPRDSIFQLWYENHINNFACHARVSARKDQIMSMTSGNREVLQPTPNEWSTKSPQENHEMDDACEMVRDLVGEEEFYRPCTNKTPFQRKAEEVGEITYNVGETGLLASTVYGIVSKAVAWKWPEFYEQSLMGRTNARMGNWYQATWMGRLQNWGGNLYQGAKSGAWNGLRNIPGRLGSLRTVLPNLMDRSRNLISHSPKLLPGIPLLLSRVLPWAARLLPVAAASGTTTSAIGTGTALTTAGGGGTAAGGGAAALGSNPLGWAIAAGAVLGYGMVATGVTDDTVIDHGGSAMGDLAVELVGPADTNGTVFKAVDATFSFLGLN